MAGLDASDGQAQGLRSMKLEEVDGRTRAAALRQAEAAAVPGVSERIVSNDNTVRDERRILRRPADRHRHVKAKVRARAYSDGTPAVFHGPRCLARYRATGAAGETPNRQAA